MAKGGQDHFGPYRLLKLVRSGHTCQVWEAVNSTDNRRVAIKALQRDQRYKGEEVTALKHEYAVGSELSNPNIIEVFEFAMDRGVPYLVMELFRGLNLKQALRQDPDQIRYLAATIIPAAAEGLGYFHNKGWIHRDIKPDNFLVSNEGAVKLIDFAIAQRCKRGLARLLPGRSKIQGTRSYMSPEQIRGETLDGRCDIYSFGCVLYEILAGKLPYTGTNADDLLTKHLRAPVPSLLSVNRAVTPEFSQLVGGMMAKDPKARPANMEEFLQVLQKSRVFRVRPKPPVKEAEA